MTESDYRYFQRRAAQERDAAERALHPLARDTHLELSRRYDEAAATVEAATVVEFPSVGRLKQA